GLALLAMAGNRYIASRTDDNITVISVICAGHREGVLVIQADIEALPAIENAEGAVADLLAIGKVGRVGHDQEGAYGIDYATPVCGFEGDAVEGGAEVGDGEKVGDGAVAHRHTHVSLEAALIGFEAVGGR